MSKRNPVYDFKWCPGCGDFGVKVAIEQALGKRAVERSESIENPGYSIACLIASPSCFTREDISETTYPTPSPR